MITETENLILKRIGISSELYAEFMFDSGYLYLQKLQRATIKRMKDREQMVKELFDSVLRNRLFWRWWTLEWQATDRAFLYSREQSRNSYFTRQTEACREMPNNVSLQLLRYAARHKVPERQTEQADEKAGGVNRVTVGSVQ